MCRHPAAAEVTAAGGRRFATWLQSCLPTRRVGDECAGLPGMGPWTLSAPVRPDNYPRRCESCCGDQGELRPPTLPPVHLAAPVRFRCRRVELDEHLKRICQLRR